MQQNPLQGPAAIILQWAQNGIATINAAYNLDGGWEGWAQVELTIALLNGGHQVAREAHVYQNKKSLRIDMVIDNAIGVELKCETYKTTWSAFAIEADITKMATYGPSIPVGVLYIGTKVSVTTALKYLSNIAINGYPLRAQGGAINNVYAMYLFVWP